MNNHDWGRSVEYTSLLSKIDTYNPDGKIIALREIEKILTDQTDAKITIHDADTEDPFLIAKLMTENPSFKLLLDGHVDVVSPEGVTNPFDAAIKDGIMYGRGVCDMKGGCSAQLTAFIAAANTEGRKGDIYLIYSSDEEYASKQIIKALDNELIPKCDFVMIAEPTSCRICTAHKGNAWMDVEFKGKSAHASTPDLGVNAIYLAMDFIARLRSHIVDTYEKQRDELYGVPTLNPGVITGGSKPNLVPPLAKLRLDKRYLPYDNYDNFLSEISTIIEACKAADPNFAADIIEIGDWPPVIVDRDNPNLINIHQAISDVLKKEGKAPDFDVWPAWGEGGFIQKYDMPVIYYGPGRMEYAHTPDEQIPVEEIALVAKGYYAAILATCF